MPVFSYVYQLFSVAYCHAYIHTLRWKERPLHCSRCQSHNVGPWGKYHYRPGLKRYWCHGCRRTFNDLTGTLFDRSKHSLVHWILATFLLCLSCSSRRIARELGVHIRTSYRWCWWLRNAALSYEMQRQLAGTVEADELYSYGQKIRNQLCGRIYNSSRPLCSANLWWALVSLQSWISTSAPALAPLLLPGCVGAPQDPLSMDGSRHGPRPRHGGDAGRCRLHGSEERYPIS